MRTFWENMKTGYRRVAWPVNEAWLFIAESDWGETGGYLPWLVAIALLAAISPLVYLVAAPIEAVCYAISPED